ncbi:MAG: PEP-CTERM sorting domain-containing protein, partial [Mycobacterium sp.]
TPASAPITQAPGLLLPAAAFLPSPLFFVPTSAGGRDVPSPPPPPDISVSPPPPHLTTVSVPPITPPAQVPEPGSLTLLAGGVLLLAAARHLLRVRLRGAATPL